jgi:hypothetical protein
VGVKRKSFLGVAMIYGRLLLEGVKDVILVVRALSSPSSPSYSSLSLSFHHSRFLVIVSLLSFCFGENSTVTWRDGTAVNLPRAHPAMDDYRQGDGEEGGL